MDEFFNCIQYDATYQKAMRVAEQYYSIADISHQIKEWLIESLNVTKTDENDWRGVASHMGMDELVIRTLETETNPTEALFEKIPGEKTATLVQALFEMNRRDLLSRFATLPISDEVDYPHGDNNMVMNDSFPTSNSSCKDDDSNKPVELLSPMHQRLREHEMHYSRGDHSTVMNDSSSTSFCSSDNEDSNKLAKVPPPVPRGLGKEFMGPEVKWIRTSIKHNSKLSKLVDLLKTRPSKAERFGIYRTRFKDEYCIGNGSNGTTVYVGLSDDGYEVAVKRMNFEKCQKIGDHEKEILNHPNVRKEKHIINYRFYYLCEDSKKACLVLDLHEETLRDYVEAKERPVKQLQNEGPSIMRQILYGVRALHCSDPEILHRDLKPSNILVNREGEMVLTDFGTSRTLPEEEATYESGMSGTEGWMAVESLPTRKDADSIPYADIQVRYKKQSDIQVVGMLCHYILTKGKHPFGSQLYRNFNILEGNFNLREIKDPGARDLIEWMIQHDPYKRPSVDECLKHPYLRAPEENFNFVTRVGNEKEIKTNDTTSTVVQLLNNLPAITNWSAVIDACVMTYMTPRGRSSYRSKPVDLLRFIRNMAVHWHDKPPPLNVQQTVIKPQEYFQRKFPDLSVDLHRIIRKHRNWRNRDELKEFF